MSEQQQQNCIALGDGWVLYSDGTLQESSTSGYGMTKKPENEFERSRLVVMYWQKKLELAIAEFDDKKAMWLASARNSLGREGNVGGPPADVAEAIGVLNGLKSKVDYAKEMLAEAEQQLEKNTPTQLKKSFDIAEQNRARISNFCAAIEQIEI